MADKLEFDLSKVEYKEHLTFIEKQAISREIIENTVMYYRAKMYGYDTFIKDVVLVNNCTNLDIAFPKDIEDVNSLWDFFTLTKIVDNIKKALGSEYDCLASDINRALDYTLSSSPALIAGFKEFNGLITDLMKSMEKNRKFIAKEGTLDNIRDLTNKLSTFAEAVNAAE